MFSGIIEIQGKVVALKNEQKNLHITINSAFTSQLKIDQSIAHNGVCLTVVDINGKNYTVTAINETLQKTNLGKLKKGDLVNLERCMKIGDRIDGHIVQGHVDCTAVCKKITDQKGSWLFEFETDKKNKDAQLLTVAKGAICVNGVSLTIVNVSGNKFSVAIIPYTYKHTNFSEIKKGNIVNIEFDVIGKYVINYLK
jgi:riboflavin synthase